MTDLNHAEGLAALGICESYSWRSRIASSSPKNDIRALLADVVITHREAATAALSPERHLAVVEIIERILHGRNGVRNAEA